MARRPGNTDERLVISGNSELASDIAHKHEGVDGPAVVSADAMRSVTFQARKQLEAQIGEELTLSGRRQQKEEEAEAGGSWKNEAAQAAGGRIRRRKRRKIDDGP